MNEIKVKVNFKNRQCFVSGVNLTSGDYNSTKIIFSFDKLDGQKIFEMKNPAGEIVFVQEIKNDEIILVGQADVTTEHDNKQYIKYLDLSENIYWYNSKEQKLYDLEWTEVEDFNLDNYIKQTENASIFTESGKYVFEVSLYDGDSKLTSACNYIPVKQEQVVLGNKVVEPYLPIFDKLMQQLIESITETSNLDVDIEGSVITIKRKDGTFKSENVKGEKGEKGDEATINGKKSINITTGGDIVSKQTGDTFNISVETPKKTSDLINDSNFATTNSNNNFSTAQTINGTLTINGDIVQNGKNYETHAEQLFTKKDLVKTRDGAIGGLSDDELTGIEAINYDGNNNGRLVFDNKGVARVGDVGDEQPLLTREEEANLNDEQVLVWDSKNLKAKGSNDYVKFSDVSSQTKLGICKMWTSTNEDGEIGLNISTEV